jgi:hypothetical protein
MGFFFQRNRTTFGDGWKKLFLSFYHPGPPKQAQTIPFDFLIEKERVLMRKLEYFGIYRCLKISVLKLFLGCERLLGT